MRCNAANSYFSADGTNSTQMSGGWAQLNVLGNRVANLDIYL